MKASATESFGRLTEALKTQKGLGQVAAPGNRQHCCLLKGSPPPPLLCSLLSIGDGDWTLRGLAVTLAVLGTPPQVKQFILDLSTMLASFPQAQPAAPAP